MSGTRPGHRPSRAAGGHGTAGLLSGIVLWSMMLAVPASAQPTPPQDLGPAPELVGIKGWLNGGPLTIGGLRGKVVLVDFWAYSCINCIRTLPWLERWQTQYGKQGLVVIGIHAPEFRFETDPRNIASAITRFGINYPVARDDELLTWKAFHNQYWPTEYLIDRDGRIVHDHAGEGEYDVTENAIRALLGIGSPVGVESGADLSRIGSPEMYFGLQRVAALASPEAPHAASQAYTTPAALALNRFALSGQWTLGPEQATLTGRGGRILLHCRSAKIFMVASSTHPIPVGLTVDGKPATGTTIHESRLYTLLDGTDYADHTLELTIPQAGLSAFTFTFG